LKRAHLIFFSIFLFLFIEIGYSTEQVLIEFFYWDPSTSNQFCPTCQPWQKVYEKFVGKKEVLDNIQNFYGNQVRIEWIEYMSEEGRKRALLYKGTKVNSIVINGEVVVADEAFNETYIKEVIDAFLGIEPPSSYEPPQPIGLIAAFSLGFFETFSPCLLALLSFVLSFTLGKTNKFKEGFLHVITFGMGFVFAVLFLAVTTIALMFYSTPILQTALMWGICVFAIVFGIVLMLFGLMNKSFQTKPIVRKLAKKYAATYAGLFMLGFLFYFLDPCIAPLLFPMLTMLQSSEVVLSLFVFCLGVILPFVAIGILAGSISKLVRSAYRHRSLIRVISGSILVVYGFYLIIFYLL